MRVFWTTHWPRPFLDFIIPHVSNRIALQDLTKALGLDKLHIHAPKKSPTTIEVNSIAGPQSYFEPKRNTTPAE